MSLPNQPTLDFAQHHCNDDPLQLLLQSARYPDIDMRWVAQQIEGLRKAKSKWPSLLQYPTYLYPPQLNREQSSSEATARYKASLIEGDTVADLTGGMGIDSLFFSQHRSHTVYVEQNATLCEIESHNFAEINAPIQVVCDDSLHWLAQCKQSFHTIYLDPARRNEGHRVVAFEDCSPNILEQMPLLWQHGQQLLIKASPMIDLAAATSQLSSVSAIHVVAVGGECKEVLFLCRQASSEPTIHCVDLLSDGTVRHHHHFTRTSEAAAEVLYTTQPRHYLYDPHAALLKGGAFRSISVWYNVQKLGRNTHLYTSDTLVPDFPGRCFEVIHQVAPTAKALRPLLPNGRCHVVTKNYPLSASQLQQQLKVHEGGNLFFVATRIGEQHIGLLCRTVDT